MAKKQEVSDETSVFMLKEMFSLVCHIQFRQASNSDIQEAVQLLYDIEEKFPSGTYHPDFEYRKRLILEAAANIQDQQSQQQSQQQHSRHHPIRKDLPLQIKGTKYSAKISLFIFELLNMLQQK